MAKKRKYRKQIAALPYRFVDGDLQILLVTSRETKRLVIPKGWPEKKVTPYFQAAREAFEEAGVKGAISQTSVGSYTYKKLLPRSYTWCQVDVYPLLVEVEADKWPEKNERTKHWLSFGEACLSVDEIDLSLLMLMFNPIEKRVT